MRNNKPAIFVRWHDCAGGDEWADYEGTQPAEVTVIESLGWLIDETDDHLVFSANHCRDTSAKEWGHIWTVPWGAVELYYEIDPGSKGW